MHAIFSAVSLHKASDTLYLSCYFWSLPDSRGITIRLCLIEVSAELPVKLLLTVITPLSNEDVWLCVVLLFRHCKTKKNLMMELVLILSREEGIISSK